MAETKPQDIDVLEHLRSEENITDYVKDLDALGLKCREGFEEDLASISEWRAEVEEIRKIARQETENKTYPWPGASNVKYPLILSAGQQFNARAYPTIINSGNIVLGKVIGDDDGIPVMQNGEIVPGPNGEVQYEVPPGIKRDRADRVARHMSYQLTEEMDEWDGDMDMLLAMLPNDGCEFKKVYRDETLGRNVSEFVSALDLVVNNNTRSLKTCPRISHIISLYPHEIRERANYGIFREPDFLKPDDNEPVELIEQHTLIDLDGDDYPEPYIVTFHKESGFVLRVAANFDEIDMDGDKVRKITPNRYFVKYECFPDPDGGFYSKGFGQLLKPINDSVDSVLNLLIDAGHLANTGGGFLGSGFRTKSGSIRFRPGEWKKMDVAGPILKDNIVPLPIREPSAVLFSLLGLLIDSGKEVASIQDVMTGGGGENTPATTVLAMIEQGMKVYSAIFKRIYRSLKEELRMLYKLNQLYLPDEVYMTVLDNPLAIARKDYEGESLDIAPAADPTMATDIQKAAKNQLLLQYAEWPEANRSAIMEKSLGDAGFTDAKDYIVPPQQGPTPEQMEKLAELNLKREELALKREEAAVRRLDTIANATKKIAESDEIGADNLMNLIELLLMEKKVEEAGIRGLEGSKPVAMGTPDEEGGGTGQPGP